MVDVRRAVTVLAMIFATAACGSSPTSDAAPPTTGPGAPPTTGVPAPSDGVRTETIPLNGRDFGLHVPASYRKGKAVPLVVLLHGYTASAPEQEGYFKLMAESDRRGFLYALPNGTIDQARKRFWNATDACCNFYGAAVDDSAYLSELIETVQSRFTVDRVFLIGHSNGAFMSYRMACEHADQITAIAGLNGAMWNDVSLCQPSRPVSILDIRGTADTTIRNEGGQNAGRVYPSAATTLADWVRFDGCGARPARSADAMDLVTNVPGPDTSVTTYSCRAGTQVEQWSIKDGTHVPAFTADFAPRVVDFLYAQRGAA